MASFINATIDDHKFDALIEVMNDHAVHLKPVLAFSPRKRRCFVLPDFSGFASAYFSA